MLDRGATIRGLILAAGYGSRLAPLTDLLPKPLLPVQGRALLDHAIDALQQAGIDEIAINSHHLGEMIARHLAGHTARTSLRHFPEAEILGTGGALDGARAFLEQADHFLIHNGDVLSDADLKAIIDEHLNHDSLATLLLVDHDPINSVAINSDGAITRIGGRAVQDDPSWRHLTYTGIGIFHKSILADIPTGYSSLIDPLVRALQNNPGCVRGVAPANLAWSDLGTPARYLAATNERDGNRDRKRDNNDQPLLRVQPVTGHGSERRFWRLTGQGRSLVAMVSYSDDQEFERYVEIGRWLNEADLGGPEILAANEAELSVLMEDVGCRNLQDIPPDELASSYQRVVDHLLDLQGNTLRAGQECPLAVDRVLNQDQLLWETDYFRQRFLMGHLNHPESELGGLAIEFSELAQVVARQPVVLMHRDFQSQNIHLQKGKVRLIDFQGMRRGPLGYDIMSLVMDPYVDLPADLKRELLERFCIGAEKNPDLGSDLDRKQISAMAVAAGLQRLMQALGAYGFLGHVQGKPAFLAHIPRALAHLRQLLGLLADIQERGSPEEKQWLPSAMPNLDRMVRLVA